MIQSFILFLISRKQQVCGLVNVNVNVKIHACMEFPSNAQDEIEKLHGSGESKHQPKIIRRIQVIHGEKELVIVRWCLPRTYCIPDLSKQVKGINDHGKFS